jgi:hypothetical protein
LDGSRGPSWAKCSRGGPRSGLPAAPRGSQLGNQHAEWPPRGPQEAPGGSQIGDQHAKWLPRGSQRLPAWDSMRFGRLGRPTIRLAVLLLGVVASPPTRRKAKAAETKDNGGCSDGGSRGSGTGNSSTTYVDLRLVVEDSIRLLPDELHELCQLSTWRQTRPSRRALI